MIQMRRKAVKMWHLVTLYIAAAVPFRFLELFDTDF